MACRCLRSRRRPGISTSAWCTLSYPGLSHTEIFDSVDTFYRSFYFRPAKIASIMGEMVRSPEVMKRRLRFLRDRRETAH